MALFISGVQLVFITICLTLTYTLVIGTMRICAMLFWRKILEEGAVDSTTYWQDAEAYQPDLDECQRQS